MYINKLKLFKKVIFLTNQNDIYTQKCF